MTARCNASASRRSTLSEVEFNCALSARRLCGSLVLFGTYIVARLQPLRNADTDFSHDVLLRSSALCTEAPRLGCYLCYLECKIVFIEA